MSKTMNCSMTRNGSELVVTIAGRLDAVSSVLLREKTEPELKNINRLIYDLSGLEYISSAGLRVLLIAYKTLNERDDDSEVILRSPSGTVKAVLELTDLLDVFKVEE